MASIVDDSGNSVLDDFGNELGAETYVIKPFDLYIKNKGVNNQLTLSDNSIWEVAIMDRIKAVMWINMETILVVREGKLYFLINRSKNPNEKIAVNFLKMGA